MSPNIQNFPGQVVDKVVNFIQQHPPSLPDIDVKSWVERTVDFFHRHKPDLSNIDFSQLKERLVTWLRHEQLPFKAERWKVIGAATVIALAVLAVIGLVVRQVKKVRAERAREEQLRLQQEGQAQARQAQAQQAQARQAQAQQAQAQQAQARQAEEQQAEEQQAQAQQAEEQRLKAQQEEEARIQKEQEERRLKAQQEEEARIQKEQEEQRLKAQQEEEARIQKEQEEQRLKAQQEEEARIQKEQEEQRKAAAEEKRKAEEAQLQAEKEAEEKLDPLEREAKQDSNKQQLLDAYSLPFIKVFGDTFKDFEKIPKQTQDNAWSFDGIQRMTTDLALKVKTDAERSELIKQFMSVPVMTGVAQVGVTISEVPDAPALALCYLKRPGKNFTDYVRCFEILTHQNGVWRSTAECSELIGESKDGVQDGSPEAVVMMDRLRRLLNSQPIALFSSQQGADVNKEDEQEQEQSITDLCLCEPDVALDKAVEDMKKKFPGMNTIPNRVARTTSRAALTPKNPGGSQPSDLPRSESGTVKEIAAIFEQGGGPIPAPTNSPATRRKRQGSFPPSTTTSTITTTTHPTDGVNLTPRSSGEGSSGEENPPPRSSGDESDRDS